MKKIILVFVLLTAFITTHSQHFFNNSFSLNTVYNGFFAVSFDHVIYQTSNRKFNLKNIRPGQHYVEINKYINKKSGTGRNPVVIAHRWITIPSNSQVFAFFDENHNICVTKVKPNYLANHGRYASTNSYKDCDYMNAIEYNRLKQIYMSASFESSTITIARQAISYKKILSGQPKELMKGLWLDSSRLELAKFSYDHTYDQENYFIVNNAFEFDSSIEELDNYISHS